MEDHAAVDLVVMGRRLLIIEDDEGVRGSLSDLLESEGFEIDVAEDGEIGWSRLTHGPRPDLILLDVMMPVLDGFGFRERQLASSFADVPVVVLSAAAIARDLQPGGRLAGCRFVPKPFDYERLEEAIEECAARRSAHAPS